MGSLHPALSTTAPVILDTVTFHGHGRSDPYLSKATSSDIREFCNANVWDEQGRPNIGSHVSLVFGTASGGLPQLAIRPGRNPDHRTFWSSSISKISVPCPLDTYLLCRDGSLDATSFASIPPEADPSLLSSVGRERAFLYYWMQMGGSSTKPHHA